MPVCTLYSVISHLISLWTVIAIIGSGSPFPFISCSIFEIKRHRLRRNFEDPLSTCRHQSCLPVVQEFLFLFFIFGGKFSKFIQNTKIVAAVSSSFALTIYIPSSYFFPFFFRLNTALHILYNFDFMHCNT